MGDITTTKSKNEPGAIGRITIMGLPVYTPTPKGKEKLDLRDQKQKMVAVHFTTMPCEPNTANRHKESHSFFKICLCSSNILYARFEVFKTFLCIFMDVFRVIIP